MATPDFENAGRALAALMGEELTATQDEAAIARALDAGLGPLLTTIPWGEAGIGATNEVALTRLDDARAYFLNPRPQPAEPGQDLGGEGQGPLRRREANGEESVTRAVFRALLALGGEALIPG